MVNTKKNDFESVITVEDLYKDFKLPHQKITSVKSLLVNHFRLTNVETQHALRGVSFEVKQGDFLGIIGRNGCGKSTLLKMIAGIYQPTKGSIKIRGKISPFLELGVGFNAELTGRENVFLNGALLGFSKKEIEARYKEIVDFAELGEFMDQKLINYSSGMQVRLAFSVAIQAQADILLLDEVLAVGDEAFQRKCYNYFKTLQQDKKTVILVTHSMDAVKSYCNKALLLEEGKIIGQGDRVEKITNRYSALFNPNIDQKEQNENNVQDRWGNGELTLENVDYKLTREFLTVDFDVVNHTDKVFHDKVDVGIDIYSYGELVSGTQYYKTDRSGFGINSKSKKHLVIKIPNDFGKHKYTVNMNIRTDLGTNTCDSRDNIFEFFNNYGTSQFYKIVVKAEWKGAK